MEIDAAELIRSMRTRIGLSQQQLATRAGMAQSAVSNYENRRKLPTLDTLDRLARAADAVLDLSYTPVGSARASPSRRCIVGDVRSRPPVPDTGQADLACSVQ